MAKGSTKPPQKSQIEEVVDKLNRSGISTLEVRKQTKRLSEDEIIERLAGGDMTKGSCMSLAIAFAANKAGMDVLDFRGGKSRKFFSENGYDISARIGRTESHTSDIVAASKLLDTIKEGERHILITGSHAAVVKSDSAGNKYYLELQSRYKNGNGWKALTEKELRRRFKAKKWHSFYGKRYDAKSSLVNIKDLANDKGFRTLVEHINTKVKDQQKSDKGSIK